MKNLDQKPACTGENQRNPNIHGVYQTDDYALVMNLEDALLEIRALRSQKRHMLIALKHISGMTGGKVGERAAKAYMDIENESSEGFVHGLIYPKKGTRPFTSTEREACNRLGRETVREG